MCVSFILKAEVEDIMNYFKDDFLWGASTSAFQIEGAYQEAGKGLSVADVRSFRKSHKQMDTKVSIDHYHHWETDLKLMKEMGLKSYRFSINWTRIFPNGDEQVPNQEGLDFYHRLIDRLIAYGIEPMVTMFHFDAPYGLVEKYGGWVFEESINDFVKYGKCLIDAYGDKVKYWFTINEQAVITLQPDFLGIDPLLPLEEQFQKSFKATLNMWIAQAKVVSYARQKNADLKIGPAISYMTPLPSDTTSEQALFAKEIEDFFSFSMMNVAIRGEIPQTFLNEIKKIGVEFHLTDHERQILKEGASNFMGLNWYCTSFYTFNENASKDDFLFMRLKPVIKDDMKYSDWGWNVDPVGLHYALKKVEDRFPGIPLVISECGWSQRETLEGETVYDTDRIEYLKSHIEAVGLAIRDGVHVIGFSPWSFIDLLSSSDGMEKRYGMVYVDRNDFDEKTQKRYKKQSYYFYQDVIKNNGID